MSLLPHYTTIFTESPPANAEVLSRGLTWEHYCAVRAAIYFLRARHVDVTVEAVNRVWRSGDGKGIRRSDLCRYIAAERRERDFRRAMNLDEPLEEEAWVALERGDFSLSAEARP